ncbi:aminotransferase class III-fold pyridoxal phosphate-dependent enzyme [Actinomadura madurae]|uniref:aminotransferase class III-fold pyridoxal phosphate-dependent enzyme n=1 Tax=Actinomadura madurae TaxID=1993 RepID=UPI0020D25C52|nr:aminotransferase class III-fold pyridoxal phosphate-dependent enzyme [Actinomadura madurae]
MDPWTHVLPWNDEDALRTLLARRGSRVAAVIMEPVMVNHRGTLPAPGYLEACRRLTRACGAQLVFDEIVTGARLAPGGAAEVFGVVPDLATYAKGIASGWPVAAVAGHRAALARVEDGTVNHRGTYNGSTASMAAVVATVDAIARRRRPPAHRGGRLAPDVGIGGGRREGRSPVARPRLPGGLPRRPGRPRPRRALGRDGAAGHAALPAARGGPAGTGSLGQRPRQLVPVGRAHP